MNLPLRRVCIALLCAAAAGAAAQDPPPAPAPSLTATPSPTPGDVLVRDDLTSATWVATRARIEPGLEELRELFLTRAPDDEIRARRTALSADLALLLEMAPFQAPNQQDGLVSRVGRLERQVELLTRDYAGGDFRSFEATDRLLRQTTQELRTLLEESDLERGLPPDSGARLPVDWNARGFTAPSFARSISAWSGEQLLDGYRERSATLKEKVRRGGWQEGAVLAREMGELARELATRTWEVPPTSRLAFRNSALRLDVLAENIHDCIASQQRAHVRRQLQLAEDAAQRCDSFLRLRAGGM